VVSGVKLGATAPTPHSSTHALAMDGINPADSPRATLLKASIIIGLFTFVGRWTDFEDVDLLVDPLLPDEKEISLFIIAAYGTNGVYESYNKRQQVVQTEKLNRICMWSCNHVKHVSHSFSQKGFGVQ